MRVCLTGGTGFLGRELRRLLEQAGHEVLLLGRSVTNTAGSIEIDLLADDPTAALESLQPTALVHLAWYAEPGKFWHDPYNLDWVAASLRLVRAFARAGGKRLITAGTCAEYDWSNPVLDERETLLIPHTLYGESKASLSRLLQHAAGPLGLSWASGRVFFPYGPFEQPGRLLSSLIDNLSISQEVAVSEGLQIRDFIHVEDAAMAFAQLLQSDIEGPVNIASGQSVSVRDFVLQAADIMGKTSLIRFGARPSQPGEPPVMHAGMRRLHGELGFSPKFALKDGLADTIARRGHVAHPNGSP